MSLWVRLILLTQKRKVWVRFQLSAVQGQKGLVRLEDDEIVGSNVDMEGLVRLFPPGLVLDNESNVFVVLENLVWLVFVDQQVVPSVFEGHDFVVSMSLGFDYLRSAKY